MDSKDTVIITGIGKTVEGEEFVNYVQSKGKIKTDKHTGQLLALMRPMKGSSFREGIVTYDNAESAEKAVRELNDTIFKCSKIKVLKLNQFNSRIQPALGYIDQFFVSHMPEVNAAWRMWKHTYQCARDGSGGTKGTPGKACTSLCSLL